MFLPDFYALFFPTLFEEQSDIANVIIAGINPHELGLSIANLSHVIEYTIYISKPAACLIAKTRHGRKYAMLQLYDKRSRNIDRLGNMC